MNRMKFLFFGVVSVYLQAMSFAAESSQYIPSSIGPKDRESYARMLNFRIGSKISAKYAIATLINGENGKYNEMIEKEGYLNIPRDELQDMLECDLDEILEIAKQDFVMWKIGRDELIEEIRMSAFQWLYDELTLRPVDERMDIRDIRKYEERIKKLEGITRSKRVNNLLTTLGLNAPDYVGPFNGNDRSKISTMREMCDRALIRHISANDEPSIGQQVFMILRLLDHRFLEEFARGLPRQGQKLQPCDTFDVFKHDILLATLTTLVDKNGAEQSELISRILHLVYNKMERQIDPLRLRQLWNTTPGATVIIPFGVGPCGDVFPTKPNIEDIENIRDAFLDNASYGFFRSEDAVRTIVYNGFCVQEECDPEKVVRILCRKEPGRTIKRDDIAKLLNDIVTDVIEIYKLVGRSYSAEKALHTYEDCKEVIKEYI